jgi:Flp pilus assembly protein TadG
VCAEGRRERGSVLLLMPAGVLVLLVLGAIAVDFSLVHLAQRELADAAAAAANDAAVAGLDEGAFYGAGRLHVDQRRARSVAAASWAVRSAAFLDGGLERVDVSTVAGEQVQVTVTARATVEMIFSKALPGAPQRRSVRAVAVATARRE